MRSAGAPAAAGDAGDTAAPGDTAAGGDTGGRPADEVAEAILFLLTNDFVTGTTVDVDGGSLLP